MWMCLAQPTHRTDVEGLLYRAVCADEFGLRRNQQRWLDREG